MKLHIIAAVMLMSGTLGANAISENVGSADTIAVNSVESALVTVGDSVKQDAAVTVNGEKYVLHEGMAYKVAELSEAFNRISNYNEADDFDWNKTTSVPEENVVSILLIVFLIPCLTLLAVCFIFIVFFKHKNSERFQLISKAIDNNYPLPDSFFGDRPSAGYYVQERGDSPSAQQSGSTHWNTVPPQERNVSNFSSGITLCAVGLAAVCFFMTVRAGGAWALGLIPLFLGIGKLIGYYFVPGFGARKTNHYDYRNNHNYCNYNTNCPPPPPGEQQNQL